MLGNFTCFLGFFFVDCIFFLNSLHAGKFFRSFCRLQIFSKSPFLKKSFSNTIKVSNDLDPDQNWHFVGYDLVQIDCKGYRQAIKVATNKEKANYRYLACFLSVTFLKIFLKKKISGITSQQK